MLIRWSLFLSSLALPFALPASAATLARYEFTAATPQSAATSSIATTADPAITVSPVLSKATGGPGDFEVSANSGTAFARASVTNSTLALAITSTDYVQFTMTVAGANTMSLSTFAFTHGADLNSGSFTTNLSVFASLDGFATGPADTDAIFTSSTTGNKSFSLTKPLLQNMVNATVTFRVYVWDNSDDNLQINRIDNITVSGTTTVPEPSAAAILGLATAGVAFARRRRA